MHFNIKALALTSSVIWGGALLTVSAVFNYTDTAVKNIVTVDGQSRDQTSQNCCQHRRGKRHVPRGGKSDGF